MPDVTLVEDRVYFGKNAMPSFKSSLSLQQMADVAAYVYSSTHGGAAPPATSQTTETTATATTGTETTGTTTEATQTTPTETTATETTATATTATETAPTETTGGGNAEAGKAIFMSAGCTGCHTLQAANSHGTVGPNLDDAKPPASLVVDRVTNGKGGMPSFKDQLTPQQIQDVAAFVSQSTGG
jgi:mono/diheme cytochrome c family protein